MKHRSLLAALLLLAAAATGDAACESGNLAPQSDAGPDATVEPVVDADTDAGSDANADAGVEASCVAFDAGALDPSQIDAGKQLVTILQCTSCHGEALSGNPDGVPSPTAIGGTAYPKNLTSDPATGLGCWTNDQIVNAILNGIDDEGLSLCAPMPVFSSGANGIGVTQAQAIVAYLRSLAPVSMNIPPTPACPVPEAGPPEEAGSDAASEASVDAGDASTPDADAASDASDASSDGADGD